MPPGFLVEREYEVSGGATLIDRAQRSGAVAELVAFTDDRSNASVREPSREVVGRPGDLVRAAHRNSAPVHADDVDVAQEQPVRIDLRYLTARKADDQQPAAGSEAARLSRSRSPPTGSNTTSAPALPVSSLTSLTQPSPAPIA